MRNHLKSLILASAVIGCGDNGGRNETAEGTGSTPPGGSLSISESTPTDSLDPGATVGATDSVTDGTNSNGNSQATTESVEPTTGVVSDSSPKTDLGQLPDIGVPACGGGGMGGDDPDFSYIWVANSAQNTISKIDTQTLVELGRYLVRPDGLGNPSRTSVNLSGDVVTASRDGGFTKFIANTANCVESNGIPGIQTSNSAAFLPYAEEECRAWHTPMAYQSQRPAAWTQGTFDKPSCKYVNQKVWTSGNNVPEDGAVEVLLVNGDTGAIEATIPIAGINADLYGIYGAAVDKKGNFWGSQLSQGWLVFIDLETKQSKQWPMAAGGYGMTVDSKGYVWTCSSQAARFDPMTETWQVAQVGGSGGCMEDGMGTLYMSGSGSTIVAVDTETLTVKQTYQVPLYVHGISIDFYGQVWGVSMSTQAYRVNPLDGTFLTFEGLVGAYTYSDMTGFALSNVGTPSG